MRIALFVHAFPSTSETFVLNQVTGLLDRGHEVSIYANSGAKQGSDHPAIAQYGLREITVYHSASGNKIKRLASVIAQGIKLCRRHPSQLLNLFNMFQHGLKTFQLKRLHEHLFWLAQENNDFDIIYCHFGPKGISAGKLRRSGYITGKLVTVFHAHDLTRYVHKNHANVYRELFAHGDLFMAITQYAKEKMLTLGCPKEKIIKHHMGVDCDHFSFQTRTRTVMEIAQIVTVGRMVEKKGFEYVIRAVAQAKAQGHRLRTILIGDGELRPSLELLAQTLDVVNETQFTGWKTQDKMTEELRQSHIMLAPSITALDGDEEGLPVVLMEALATGLPVITTLHAGIPELIIEGKTGYMVSERDLDALAQRLCFLINHPEKCQELATAGRREIEMEFNIDILNDLLIAHFEQILEP